MAGIVGYGAYIPRNRIKVEEIAKTWGADAPSYKRGLQLYEKSVPSPDQEYIWAASDEDILTGMIEGDFIAGESVITDEVTLDVKSVADQINQLTKVKVSNIILALEELNKELEEYIDRTDEYARVKQTEIGQARAELEVQIPKN